VARIPLCVPELGGNAASYLAECLATNWVSTVGPFVSRFEREFARRVQSPHAVACSTGTAAIHLALLALGVGTGDEVWVSDLTFIASANPARYCGATVTLIDSEPATWNLDPDVVVDELEERARRGDRMPAAIVAVHLLGHPARLAPILRAAAVHGVPVIEDAAEALGSDWCDGELSGRQAGTVSTVGCFSFNGNKVITTGGGGMLVTADESLAARARHLSTQAKLAAVDYRHDEVGYNYRLTNLAAALGVAQLERLDDHLVRKREIAERYDKGLAGLPGVTPPPREAWARSSVWLYSPLLDTFELRESVRLALAAAGVEARPVWTPLHEQRPYSNTPVLGGGAVASDVAARALSLPSSVGLTGRDQDEVVGIIVETLEAGGRA
jgi:dTDP-4-amino-4,6-dideoxygalactose transaminase